MFSFLIFLAIVLATSDYVRRKKRKADPLRACDDRDDDHFRDDDSSSLSKYGSVDMDISNSSDNNPLN